MAKRHPVGPSPRCATQPPQNRFPAPQQSHYYQPLSGTEQLSTQQSSTQQPRIQQHRIQRPGTQRPGTQQPRAQQPGTQQYNTYRAQQPLNRLQRLDHTEGIHYLVVYELLYIEMVILM